MVKYLEQILLTIVDDSDAEINLNKITYFLSILLKYKIMANILSGFLGEIYGVVFFNKN